MTSTPARALACLLAIAAVLVPSASRPAPAPSQVFELATFAKAFDAVPCEDAERFAAVQALFASAGAPATSLRVDSFDGVQNLVVTKPGASAETIVIGAHYDKVAQGCGAIDNWTGIVVLAHLYQTLRDIPTQKTVQFVAFGREEKGLVGAKAMVKAIEPARLDAYCAMVNIDSLGMGPPQVGDNMSSKPLVALAAALASEMQIPFAHARIGGANADSSAFIARGIPAVTLHGLNNNWHKVLHSARDQPGRINAASVYLGYRLALLMAVRLDKAACNAYR